MIDWGGAGYGDPEQDLAPAWSMFQGRARDAFREAMDVDDASWSRAMAFELGTIMQQTLGRIFASR